MIIYVQYTSLPVRELQVSVDESVRNIKNKIHNLENITAKHMELYYVNTQLEDHFTLAHYKIPDGATVRCKCT